MRRYVAAPIGPPKIDLRRIPKGYAGTKKTVAHIKALIRQGTKDFYVRQKAIDILLAKGVKPKDYLGEIKALFEWVQQSVRYTKDPFRVEVLHSARRLLELRAGDCDDMSILLGAMLEAIGHPVRLVLVGRNPLKPLLFSHVYLEVYYQGRWIPLDPTMPYPMGWAPQVLVKKTVPLTRGSAAASPQAGLGCAPCGSQGKPSSRPCQCAHGTIQNASLGEDVRQGAALYRTFNRFDPSRVVKVRHSRAIPPVVVELGELVGLMYRSDKWHKGRPQTYIHFMEKPPRLVSNAKGTQLYIVGGSYRVTERGIEG
jgi:hypothetical protein